MPEGMVISKAPSRLKPKATKSSVMNPLTQGLEPSVTIPNGPRMRRAARPRPLKSTMIPKQKIAACATPPLRLRKYDMVIGIMGKTQGVKMEASPKPKATAMKAARPWSVAGESEAESDGDEGGETL